MIWFIEHPEAWEPMGQHNRKMAEQRFDVHQIKQTFLEIMGLESSR